MKMRKALFCVSILFCIILQSCCVTTQQIIVEPKVQNSITMCWAACMEMVMGYHHKKNNQFTTLTQCELAVDWQNAHGDFTEMSCCIPGCSVTCIHAINSLNNIGLYFEKLNYVRPNYKPMLEEDIKKQIDKAKTPFITSINSLNDSGSTLCNDDHVIVTIGYKYSDIGFFVLGIDPSNIGGCNTSPTLAQYPISPEANAMQKVCSFIWNIVPQGPSTRLRPNSHPISFAFLPSPIASLTSIMNELPDTIGNKEPKPSVVLDSSNISASIGSILSKLFNKNKFQGEQLKNLTNEQFAKLVSDKDYSIVPVKYIDFSKLTNAIGLFTTDNVELKNVQVVDVIYNKINPTTVNRFQRNGTTNKWKTILVLKQNDELQLFKKNNPINWNEKVKNEYWKKDNSLQNESYEKILVPPFNYEFHKYKSGNAFMYIPSADYNDLLVNGSTLKKGQSYEDKAVLKVLQGKAFEYLKNKK